MLVLRCPHPSIERFLCHGRPGCVSRSQELILWVPGHPRWPQSRIQTPRHLQYQRDPEVHPQLYLPVHPHMRPLVQWTPKTRRSDRRAHIIKLPASTCRKHDRCSTQAPESTSTQNDFGRQVNQSVSRRANTSLDRPVKATVVSFFMIISPKVSPIRSAAALSSRCSSFRKTTSSPPPVHVSLISIASSGSAESVYPGPKSLWILLFSLCFQTVASWRMSQ